MRASDRALGNELRQIAGTLPPKQAEVLHAAALRLRQLSRGEPAPPKLTITPTVAPTSAPALATIPAKAEQRAGVQHGGR